MRLLKSFSKRVILIGFTILLPLITSAIAKAEPIKMLLVTGGHGFEEKEFFEVYQSYRDIEYTHVEQPKANQMFEDGSAKKYDVVALYDMWQEITDAQQKGVEEYLNEGKGLVVMHHAICSYQNWDAYQEIIGGAYILNKNGRELGGKVQGPSDYKHDEDMKIQVVDQNHPITRGILDFEIQDETYNNTYLHPKAHVLLKTDHPNNSAHIAWVMPHDKARVAYIQLGHDSKAYANENYRKIIHQAIRWAAQD